MKNKNNFNNMFRKMLDNTNIFNMVKERSYIIFTLSLKEIIFSMHIINIKLHLLNSLIIET